jgi:hypothetical protein
MLQSIVAPEMSVVMKTLITDGFEEDAPKGYVSPEVHNIVYGSKGFTDALDAETIKLLAGIGAISFVRAIDHEVAETRLYASRLGAVPPPRT